MDDVNDDGGGDVGLLFSLAHCAEEIIIFFVSFATETIA